MNNQRLRNLTTHRLHTDVVHVYKDIEYLTGEKGWMTHMLPNAMRAMEPWLREKITDQRFFDGTYDLSHIGKTAIKPMTKDELAEFTARYEALPHPFTLLGTDR